MQELFSSLNKINPFSRKEIFAQYRLPDDPRISQQRITISKDKKKNDEILIRQMRLFKFNLEGVIGQKNRLIQSFVKHEQKISSVLQFIAKFNQGQKDEDESIKERFKQLERNQESQELIRYMTPHIQQSRRKEKSPLPLYFVQSMILYKMMLNVGIQLKYEAESFRLGTLSNYDPSTTKTNFTKSSEQAEDSILSYILRITQQSSRAMEAKVRQTNKLQKDRFLVEDDKYVACWKSLQELYNSKQVELIHFDMLNILDSFDSFAERFSKVLQSHKLNYKKYQGVIDSFELMDRQIKEMQHVIEMKNQLLQNLANKQVPQAGTLQRAIENQSNEQISIIKNIKIYHINEKLFANYNTETNLTSYYQLRKLYSIKLQELEDRIDLWREELQAIKEISFNYSRIDDIITRKIANSGCQSSNGNNRGKKNFLSNCAQQNDSELVRLMVNIEEINTRKHKQLNVFTRSLLGLIKQRIGGQNITDIRFTQNKGMSLEEDSKDAQILDQEKSFFLSYMLVPNNKRKLHLIEHLSRIKEYVHFNNKIKNDRKVDTQRVKKYLWEFQICVYIGKKVQSIHGLNQIANFQNIIQDHLQEMDKKLRSNERFRETHIDELLYWHLYDYSLFNQLFKGDLWKKFVEDIDSLSKKQYSRMITFTSSTDQKSFKELVFFTQKLMQLNYVPLLQNLLQIYSSAMLKINSQISFELLSFQDYLWQIVAGSIKKAFRKTNYYVTDNMSHLSTLDSQEFFTVPALLDMKESKQKIKRIESLVLKVIKKLYNNLGNFEEFKLTEAIVCLTLLKVHINDGYDDIDKKETIPVLSKMRRFLTVQLLKLQYGKMYQKAIQSEGYISPQQINIILGIEKYLSFKDPSLQSGVKSSFAEDCEKYLAPFQKQIRPLSMNIPTLFSSQRPLAKIQNLLSFQLWFSQLSSLISNRTIPSLYLFSYLKVQQNNIQQLIKLTESPQVNKIKESEGFLIKMIKKENFYLKKQIIKFRLLAQQKIWENYKEILLEAIEEIEKKNQVDRRDSKIQKLKQIDTKVKRILINAQKKSF